LLEALALHVQHARTLPSSLREQLVRAPFGLDEAQSLEARQQALALARALNLPAPPGVSIVRAMQTAMQPDASVTPARSPHESNTFVGKLVVNTRAGRVVIAITENAAPEAARVVVEAAQGGRYNGTTFHRVVPGFVAQGGDPRGDGYGGTNNIVPTELSGMRFDRGAVGIALAGLDTGGMQFFVMTADAPHLDARYPWIGRVVEGMEVVDELMAGDVIERVEFIAR
jgi:cyclophilin family peptidyl-prolyl cis-trans isomerase